MWKRYFMLMFAVILFLIFSPQILFASVTAQIVTPIEYELTGDWMSGNFALTPTLDGLRARIDLVMNESPHDLASIPDATATFENGKITIKSLEDDAQVTITFINEDTVIIEANEEAQLFAGLNAAFDGTYHVKETEESIKKRSVYESQPKKVTPDIAYNLFTETIGQYSLQKIRGVKPSFEDMGTVTDEYGEEEFTAYMRAWKGGDFCIVRGYEDDTWQNDTSFLAYFWTKDTSVNFDFPTFVLKVGMELSVLMSVFGDELVKEELESNKYSILGEGSGLSFEVEKARVKSITYLTETQYPERMSQYLGFE